MGSIAGSKKLKRQMAPTFWGINRKEKRFVITVRPGSHPKNNSIPTAVLLRDTLKKVKTLREAKSSIYGGKIKVDGIVQKSLHHSIGLMDVVELEGTTDVYRLIPKNGHILEPLKIDAGEKSKNYLEVKKILIDCDYDAILILANPKGPTCHTSNYSCFKFLDESVLEKEFSLGILEDIIQKRKEEKPKNSYTTKLFNEGKNKITQKIGEEATEVIVAALAENKINLIEESADLLYHLLVLLSNENISLSEIILKLHERNKKE